MSSRVRMTAGTSLILLIVVVIALSPQLGHGQPSECGFSPESPSIAHARSAYSVLDFDCALAEIQSVLEDHTLANARRATAMRLLSAVQFERLLYSLDLPQLQDTVVKIASEAFRLDPTWRGQLDCQDLTYRQWVEMARAEDCDEVLVELRSDPAEARISVSGQFLGHTNKGVFLCPGQHDITLTRDGYATVDSVVEVAPGQANQFHFDLDLIKGDCLGGFRVTVEPLEASVVLKRGTRLVLEWQGSRQVRDLECGHYALVATMAGRAVTRHQVEIRAGTFHNIDVVLPRAKPGTQSTSYVPASQVNLHLSDIPATTIMVGDSTGDADEVPQCEYRVAAYEIASMEVTQDQYLEMMADYEPNFLHEGRSLPATGMTWTEALIFCNRISISEGLQPCYEFFDDSVRWHVDAGGYRLPTEVEWECAARCGAKDADLAYSGAASLDLVGWYVGNSMKSPHPVGGLDPNGCGVYDMSGNVAEWCWDDYVLYTVEPRSISFVTRSDVKKVVRGGTWLSADHNCRVAQRQRAPADGRSDLLGFRICRSR